VLTGGVLIPFFWLLLGSGMPLVAQLALAILLLSSLAMTVSVFLRMNRHALRREIITRIEEIASASQGVCSAIKFDVDLIVALNEFSFSLGNRIIASATDLIQKAVTDLRRHGSVASSFELPESDETIVIIGGMTVEDAADVADSIRRALKDDLNDLHDYREACEYVKRRLQQPPLTPEECEGIGTLSAGVASYTRGAEGLLSDIAAAVKASKYRGRNKTIIYQRDQPSLIRSDYHVKRPSKRGY
jgi:GGDEF domain-containing protein